MTGPKVTSSVRWPDDVREWLEGRRAAGHKTTDDATEGVRVLRALIDQLGPDYFELERRSKVERVPLGQVVADLVARALAAERSAPAPPKRKR